ncbi:hypothetical protein ACHQM5_029942 [Ranunculus cassubicifolius]
MEKVIGDSNLLEEILLRVPPEIVVSFKPVSKHWYKLISSLSFRRRHGTCHLHIPNSKILMLNQGKASATTLLNVRNEVTVIKTSTIESELLSSIIWPFYEKLQKAGSGEIEFGIHDAYNGLFLFSLKRRDRGEVYYLVCNPLTKEYQELPKSKHTSPFTEVVFAPSKSPCCYKVIVVSINQVPHGDYADYIVQVYSSENRTWKDSGRQMIRHSLYDSKSIVWDNCAVVVPAGEWLGSVCVLDSERLRVSHSSSLLPTFDENLESSLVHYFGESGGFLHVVECIECDWDREKDHYRLWEMEGGGDGSWKEKFQFNTIKDARTLYVHREGEGHVWLLLLLKSRTVYYCLNGNTESLEEAGDVGHRYWRWSIRSYTPTLFPLGG